MKKTINLKPIIGMLLIISLSGCTLTKEPDEQTQALPGENPVATDTNTPINISDGENPAKNSEIKVGDTVGVSRGLAAKMVALAFNDINSIYLMERVITYADTTANMWYDKYINAATLTGHLSGDGSNFMPDTLLSISQAQALIFAMNPSSDIEMKITNENKDKAISYALWCTLYEECLTELSVDSDLYQKFGIEEKDMVILADSSNNSVLQEGYIIADSGPYSAEGLIFSPYIDNDIKVLLKDNEVILVKNMNSQTPKINGAYIVSATENEMAVFLGGAQRTYAHTGNMADKVGKTCDFVLKSNIATDITIHDEVINDTVKLISNEYVEFQNSGIMPLGEDFRVYSNVDNALKWKSLKNIIVGENTAEFSISGGVVVSAVITKTVEPKDIRVAIKTSNFEAFIHKNVIISGSTKLTMKIGENQHQYNPGEQINFAQLNLTERAYITCETGTINIESISRNSGIPTYRGIIEVSPKDGGFVLINQINLEEYLYAVLPSEMPTSFGQEALKVQAITARSYAYNQYFDNTFHEYGANVCDSVISQVYNNTPENADSIKAVDATRGQCLTYAGSVISANFFSTSGGVTANNGDVWANSVTKEFPTETKPYLKGKPQYLEGDFGDLSIEENMAEFIKNTDVAAYDSSSPWFRWYVELTKDEISASINSKLKERYNANPKLIQTLDSDGIFRSKPVETIGSLTNMEVLQRGKTGNIMTMKITGTQNTIVVNTEYNIRSLISPNQKVEGANAISLQLHDDTVMENYGIMPSSFYTMERMTDGEGNILFVKFYGGGNGHGVGMSQTGVKGMASLGFTYEEILAHYYEGTLIQSKW